MNDIFIWRCGRCSHLFSIITITEGVINQQKICTGCNWQNILTLSEKGITIRCKPSDRPRENSFDERADYCRMLADLRSSEIDR